MELRSSVSSYAFDSATFERLRGRVGSGALDPAANRLDEPPTPLQQPPVDLRASIAEGERARLHALGEDALRRGRVAILVLNGGMATRFGGGAKGIVPVVPGHPRVSFLAIKLAEVRQQAEALGAAIPAVIMHSFATQGPSQNHLAEIGWGGVPERDRDWFAQSIMPRVLPDGTPLQDLPEASGMSDDALYCAPGHGDTLPRLRESGVLSRLQARGVEHVLVSNVDNVGATLDPFVLGAHLEAGAGVSVEVVRRIEGDAGGCVATLPGGRAAIIEGFRLPKSVDLAHYPHFNTNTLWLSLAAVDRDVDLTWFAVRKEIEWPTGQLEVVQFERLIGQVTEFVDSAYLEVERDERFLPIKTREDLTKARPALERFAHDAGLL